MKTLADEIEALRKEIELDEQRVADLMGDVNRLGFENEALRNERDELQKHFDAQCESADALFDKANRYREVMEQAVEVLERVVSENKDRLDHAGITVHCGNHYAMRPLTALRETLKEIE